MLTILPALSVPPHEVVPTTIDYVQRSIGNHRELRVTELAGWKASFTRELVRRPLDIEHGLASLIEANIGGGFDETSWVSGDYLTQKRHILSLDKVAAEIRQNPRWHVQPVYRWVPREGQTGTTLCQWMTKENPKWARPERKRSDPNLLYFWVLDTCALNSLDTFCDKIESERQYYDFFGRHSALLLTAESRGSKTTVPGSYGIEVAMQKILTRVGRLFDDTDNIRIKPIVSRRRSGTGHLRVWAYIDNTEVT